IKLICNKEHVGLIAILKTKIKTEKIDQVASRLFGGWGCITNLSEHYNMRIWVAWRLDCFKVDLLTKNTQVVTYQVNHVSLQVTFVLTIVYVFNTKEERRSLYRGVNSLWIVMGDLNFVLNIEDIIGGNSITMAEIADFHQCVENCELMELPTNESRYT
ncbi:hypothetical protein A4A49_59754, partial [Nicotiana attenuata]